VWEPATPQAQAEADRIYGARRSSRSVEDRCADPDSQTLIMEWRGEDTVTENGQPLIVGHRYELCLSTGVVYVPPFSGALLLEMLYPDNWSLRPEGPPS
jgi:hypothetical protein